MKKVLIAIGVFLVFLPASIEARGWKAGTNISGSYQIGYKFNNRVTIEVVGEFAENARCYGPKIYYYFQPYTLQKPVIYLGAWGGYVDFKTKRVKGEGYIGHLTLGYELPIPIREKLLILEGISVVGEVGPAVCRLHDTETKISILHIDIVAKLTINFYF
jgi:hypothetical protein